MPCATTAQASYASDSALPLTERVSKASSVQILCDDEEQRTKLGAQLRESKQVQVSQKGRGKGRQKLGAGPRSSKLEAWQAVVMKV